MQAQDDLPCVDILVCNAGVNGSAIAPRGPGAPMTEDGFNALWQVNYLGHFALTRLLVPRLRASRQPGGARIVNVVRANRLGFAARRGVVWRGVAWRGVAWRGVARRGVAWRGVAWGGVAWRGVSRRGAWRGLA